MAEAKVDRDWTAKYASGDTPWDSGIPSSELLRVIQECEILPCRSLELGCGTGTNAVALAELGFEMTAVDCTTSALEAAQEKAAAAGVTVDWVDADVTDYGAGLLPFDFIFDRGCYHCCRRVDLSGYLQTLKNVTRPGSRLLVLTGNANRKSEQGPPRVTESDLRSDFGDLMKFVDIREFRFEGSDGNKGPLGWSVLLEIT